MIESSQSDGVTGTLRYGMVGGGDGAFIGDVHRKAAALDGKCALVAGCFSRDPAVTAKTGAALGIQQERLYASYQEMAAAEAKREDRPDFISIVAPNSTHFEAAKAFLERGFHIVCEKPLTLEVWQAEELQRLANARGLLFCVMYSYSGYPLVAQARQLVRDGRIGDILMVMGEYPQDWLVDPIEKGGQKQAAWRTDPERAGISNCTGDIGSHVEHMVAHMTGLKIDSLCARLETIGEDRMLDTNSSILLTYEGGATGMYWSSQIAIGNDNGLKVRIYGTKGAIEWSQEEPNTMKVTFAGKPSQIYSRGHAYLYPAAASRLPSGHTEGLLEAFANIYNRFATAVLKKKAGLELGGDDLDFPGLAEGTDGVRFIHAAVQSAHTDSAWVRLADIS